MKSWQIPDSTIELLPLHMPRKNDCDMDKLKVSFFQFGTTNAHWDKTECFLVRSLPKVTKPALADSVSLGAPSNSCGAVGDHEQEGALLSAAARLASTNSYIYIHIIKMNYFLFQ